MMIRRFAFLGAALAMSAVYMQEADDAGGDLGGTDPAVAAAPTTKVDVPAKATPEVQAPEPQKGDAEALDAAGFAADPNDPGLTYTLGFLAKNGFTSETPSVAAALKGDFSLLKAELAQKGAAGWEQAIGLAEQSYDRHVKELDAQATKVGEIVTAFAESQGVDWEQAVQHVANTANDDEKSAINELLGNPATAHIAAAYITGAYINGSDTEVQPQAKATSQGGQQSREPAGGPLSRAEYTKEMAKLRDALGEDYLNSPQAQALYRRRQG